MFKRFLIISALLISVTSNVYGMTTHELAMSYVLADQDKPREIGDVLYQSEVKEENPVLMETTAYYRGSHGSHGDLMREGYVASRADLYGAAAVIYKADTDDAGNYSLGDYIGTFEIKDTGYGYSTGQGKSRVREDKKYAGTIEKGIHIDVYRDNYERCKQWMQLTKGKIFVLIVPAEG